MKRSAFGGAWINQAEVIDRSINFYAMKKKVPRPALIYSDSYDVSLDGLEEKYCFDMHKYRKIHGALAADMPPGVDFLVPSPLTREQLLDVHTPLYLSQLEDPKKMAEFLEFPPLARLSREVLKEKLLKRILHISGGSLLACREALGPGLAFNIGGGYHHALAECGGGFCALADIAVALKVLLAEGVIGRAAILDCDLHQGNGNAEIFKHDPRVYTFSIHQENNYPFVRAESDLDIGLSSKKKVDDALYLETLAKALPGVLDTSCPDLAVFLAGTDVYDGDFMGGFKLTRQGILDRDLLVFNEVRKRGIPLAGVTAGGYAESSWEIHAASIRALVRAWYSPEP